MLNMKHAYARICLHVKGTCHVLCVCVYIHVYIHMDVCSQIHFFSCKMNILGQSLHKFKIERAGNIAENRGTTDDFEKNAGGKFGRIPGGEHMSNASFYI